MFRYAVPDVNRKGSTLLANKHRSHACCGSGGRLVEQVRVIGGHAFERVARVDVTGVDRIVVREPLLS